MKLELAINGSIGLYPTVDKSNRVRYMYVITLQIFNVG